mgnify:CR=1 FL=1
MPKLSRNIWERLRKAGIIDTYDAELRNEQIRKAGPYKLMSIRGIGVRSARLLLKNAGWDLSLEYLKNIYDKLHNRTKYEDVKAKPKFKEEKPKEKKTAPETPKKEEAVDKRERRYIAFAMKTMPQFNELFSLVEKNGGIPYDGRVHHKMLHLTIIPPQEILFRDVLAKVYGIINYKLPSSFEIVDTHKFPNNPKIMFFGKLDSIFNLIKTPHLTFAEFNDDAKCLEFYNANSAFFNKFKGLKMEIESLAVIKKDYGVEYAIPITALVAETKKFMPEQIKVFLDFLGHKNPIKYQVFKQSIDGKHQGSGRNTYVGNAEEVVNLASIDNGKGIICVAISEHGNKQTEDLSNITRILALTVDVDVKKDRKIMYVSSKEDHLHAINVAFTTIRNELQKMGFKVGMITDSGNGAHSFVKVGIDLPEYVSKEDWAKSDIYGRLVTIENVLRNKLKEMNDQIVNIDFITKDVVRRVKMPGTINKKDVNQAEDRICRIIYKADDYAEESNNKAFLAVQPTLEPVSVAEKNGEPAQESQALMADSEVSSIFEKDPKLKALFEGNIVKHGEDKPLEFKDGKIYCKSRSEAENSLVGGLVAHGIRNFEQINGIMMQTKIGKWQEDRNGAYRRRTFEKALSFVKTTKMRQPEELSDFEKLRRTIQKIKK